MIGVLAPASDRRVISEFFELFKTPWEYLRSDRDYEVILCVGSTNCDAKKAKLVLHYSDCRLPIDAEEGVEVELRNASEVISENGRVVVVHGDHLLFRESGREADDGEEVKRRSYRRIRDGATINRIGYDLFAEIGHLLGAGQPEEFARFPALDLHISFLRDLIVEEEIELLEIPPVPEGYECIACLTHDIDHPGIRFHQFDATAFGFLYRATAGSFADFVRGRVSFKELIKNWLAAAKLPFVYVGWVKDFWADFEGRYLEFEEGIRSTYFVVPFKSRPGTNLGGPAPQRRATGYGAEDIKESLARIRASGNEIGLHGIDAWRNSESGRSEMEEIRKVTGDTELGIRMHWLFYDEKSPQVLEDAGAAYDSTIGYRATVGFRSGTAQAYRPLGVEQLLELPLHIMDTALFYPAYLGLSQKEAEAQVRDVIASVAEVGGCLTVNWHDRSLAAERNWVPSYRSLIDELKKRKVWFATAGEAAAWFRMRRSVVFGTDQSGYDMVAMVNGNLKMNLPALKVLLPGADCAGIG